MYRLLPIQTTALDQDAIPTVNARDLHAFLDVRKAFAAWIQDRIAKFGFVQNQDLVIDFPNLENQNGRGGDRRTKEYHLTLDMARELAMVERSERPRANRHGSPKARPPQLLNISMLCMMAPVFPFQLLCNDILPVKSCIHDCAARPSCCCLPKTPGG
jgi:phage anti-repressor protein